MDELHHESKHKPHRLISPLLPPPLGWPKIFFSSSLLSFIFNQIRYKYCKQCRTHDSTEPHRKGNAKLQILVFDYAIFSFEFVTFRRFFYIFSRYISSISPFYPKNSRLQASTTAYPLATGTILSLTEILLRLAGEVARRAGGVSHAQE